MIRTAINPDTPRVVLDTNACLDLLLFDDPRCAPLGAALRAGTVHAVCDRECADEWQRVLGYPQLSLDSARRDELQRAFDALMHDASGFPPRDALALPRCADPDDQKFIALAYAARASWLVSRDLDVLALAPRTARAGWFRIVTPQAWIATLP